MGRAIVAGGKPAMDVPVTFPANFEDATWEQVIEACQKNAVPETWVVGDQKAMTINGTNYLFDIIGKNHDTYSDGSGTAPLTFQMHDCYSEKYGMNSSNTTALGWKGCVMRTTRLPAILALMPSVIQSAIKEVDKLTSAGYSSSAIETVADKLFLLSEVEVFGKTTGSASGEGKQYEYYRAGNSKVKYFGTIKGRWWERSPVVTSNYNFCNVHSDGTAYMYSSGSNAFKVSFAFCF